MDRAVVGVVGRHAIREFMHVRLAEKNSARFLELPDDNGVFLGNEVFQDF